MTNSTSLIGVIPGSSSGNTSVKSQTIGTLSIPSRGATFKAFRAYIRASAFIDTMKKLDDLGAIIKCDIVSFQPIHAKDKVDGGGFQNVWRNHELKSLDLDSKVRCNHVDTTLGTGSPDY